MSRLRATWAAMGRASRIAAVGSLAVVVIAIAAALVFLGRPAAVQLAEVAATPPPATEPPPLPPTPSPGPSIAPTPLPSPSPPGADALLGTDGRLTVLLLGSDYRPAHPGNRTDAIMVVSVDPTTGRSAGFSIPRDTVNFPLPGGGRYGPKVNGLYQHLLATTPNGGEAMKAAIAKAFDIEVDRYVFIGFAGVKRLVSAVGGVDVTLARAYYDPYYWVSRTKQGWGLPAGTSHLNAEQALIFARSRKGDNDFGRARRQQILVMAALDKVRRRGPALVPKLVSIAQDTVRTDLPLDRSADLYQLFTATDLSKARSAVFGPRAYATGTAGGSFALRIEVCRGWIIKNFPPLRPFGAWPEPLPLPSPAQSPVSPGSPAP